MKELVKDKLIQLATAQEFMVGTTDKLVQWDKSQLTMEKSAFDSLNLSDEVLNLSKSGSVLVGRLLECCQELLRNPRAAEQKKVALVLEELLEIFGRIEDSSARINEISHRIESEAETQKEIEEGIKNSLGEMAETIDTAAACAEFMMSEF